MTRTVPTGRGHEIVEIPPAVLACGCRFTPRRVTVGYNPHPSGVGRARCYFCREHRVWTWDEPDPI